MNLLEWKRSTLMNMTIITAALCVIPVSGAMAADTATEEPAPPDSLASIFTEGTFDGVVKALWFGRDYDGDKTDMSTLAIGGNLLFETAPLHGISAGVGFKTSQGDLLSDDDKDFYSGLLAPGDDGEGDSYTALDEYYLRYNNWNTDVKLGAFAMDTPWMQGFDIRMTPKKYRGVRLDNTSIDTIKIHLSYIADWMDWTDDSWESVASGLTGNLEDDDGAVLGGLTWQATKSLELQIWDNYFTDVMNSIYARLGYSYTCSGGYTLAANAKYLDQRDTGDALAGDLGTYMAGGDVSLSSWGAKLTLYYGEVGDNSIKNPFGGDYVVIMQTKWIERADEESWGVRFDYDFERLGLKGLSMWLFYSEFDTPDSGDNASTDMAETDFSLLYKFSGWFENLSAQFRYAHMDQDEDVADGNDWDDLRFYLVYRF